MQICEDPYKCSRLLAGSEGSPWNGTVRVTKGRHSAGLRKNCHICCCISGCRLHVPCRVFITSTVLEWQDRWCVGGFVHNHSSGSKTSGVTLCRHCVMQAHRMSFPTAWHLWEAIRLRYCALRPFCKVRHRKSSTPPPKELPVVWITWLLHRYASTISFFIQIRHYGYYSD
jgi:hypothetical protein